MLILSSLDRLDGVFDVERGVTQRADGVVLLIQSAREARDFRAGHADKGIVVVASQKQCPGGLGPPPLSVIVAARR
jgi:hypothetical protein